MKIDACSYWLENTWPRTLKSWGIRIRTMDTCNNSLRIFVNRKVLIFTSLNSSGMTNSMCEIRLCLFKITRRSLWSIFSTSLVLSSSNTICIEGASSNILLFRIIGDAWNTSLWFSKISLDPSIFDCSLISKITLDYLSKTSFIWSHESCTLAMLFGMSLVISNIWLTIFDMLSILCLLWLTLLLGRCSLCFMDVWVGSKV